MSYITSDQLIRKLRTQFREMDVYELKQRLELDDELVLIDIRELDEWAQGRVEGAIHIPRGFLELQIENNVVDRNRPIAIMCAGGVRSLLGARDLAELGYTDVASVAGGFGGWKNAGFKFSVPRLLTEDQRHRYSRHTIMPEVGEEGQLKLLDASVLLIGAGGLGSPAAIYLAAAGIGKIGLVDFDVQKTCLSLESKKRHCRGERCSPCLKKTENRHERRIEFHHRAVCRCNRSGPRKRRVRRFQ